MRYYEIINSEVWERIENGESVRLTKLRTVEPYIQSDFLRFWCAYGDDIKVFRATWERWCCTARPKTDVLLAALAVWRPENLTAIEWLEQKQWEVDKGDTWI